MALERIPLGVFTVDDKLFVRTWDGWLARATGIEPAEALNRPLVEVIPELRTRGLLSVIENVLARGTVEVLAPALHHYLIACPPMAPSASFQHMQQHVTMGPLRDNGQVVGVVVTVEDVTDRVESERWLAGRYGRAIPTRRDRSGGERPATGEDVNTLTQMLAQPDLRTRGSAVATLATQGQAIVSALVRTIREQHADFNVLSGVLDLLAVSDIDIIAPLIECLDDRDTNLRIQAALILGQRRDRRAIEPLIAHLKDEDVNVRFHIIEALGRLHASEAADALVEIAEQRDFFLAFPAIQALSHVSSADVAPRLVPLLADELLRAPVIDALGELGDEDVAAPLVQLLNTSNAPPDVIADALAGLHDRYQNRYGAGEHIADLFRRHINATGTQNILDAVRQVSADRLPGLAKVLGWLESEAAQRTLTRLLGQEAVRSQVVEALVRYGSGVVALLIEQLRAEDLETRQAAAVALGRIGDCRATLPLVMALEDRAVTVAAAGALARLGDREAFEPLMALLGDADSAIRQAAIAALNSIGHLEMPGRIVDLLAHVDPTVRESALKIAGYFGYAESLDRVLAAARDESESVRRTAVEQLALFEDVRVFEALAGATQDVSPQVRSAAAAAMVRVGHPSRGEALMLLLNDSDPWVRYVALRSLGAVGDGCALPAVLSRLQHDSAPHVRLAAIEVVGRLQPPEVLQILEPLAQSDDQDVARAAISALGHVDHPGALGVLEGFLHAPHAWRRHVAIEAIANRRDARVPHMLQWAAAADDQPQVAAAAVDALVRVGVRQDPQAVDATRALVALTAEPSRRERAIKALSQLPSRRIPDIAVGLRHPTTDVRRASVQALSRMKQPAASRAVETALHDTSSAVRLTAVAELKRLGTRSSQSTLLTLARTDPDDDVRQAAKMAVARKVLPGEMNTDARTSPGL